MKCKAVYHVYANRSLVLSTPSLDAAQLHYERAKFDPKCNHVAISKSKGYDAPAALPKVAV